jgi:hypothetical protein
MHLLDQAVEHPDPVDASEERPAEVPPDESCAAGDEDGFGHDCSRSA